MISCAYNKQYIVIVVALPKLCKYKLGNSISKPLGAMMILNYGHFQEPK